MSDRSPHPHWARIGHANRQCSILDLFIPKHLGRASLDDLAGRQASWTRYRYPAVFGPVVTHLVTHRSVMAHTSRGGPPRNGAVNWYMVQNRELIGNNRTDPMSSWPAAGPSS